MSAITPNVLREHKTTSKSLMVLAADASHGPLAWIPFGQGAGLGMPFDPLNALSELDLVRASFTTLPCGGFA